ncbi:MAG: alpha/beta hydrolase family protein [Segniliparus sp.]|uniref:alpha/beta hydrolase family protein n=1 Tax=Segniliparus sp. TaxID=2804064 RepID=UPI003F358FA3
MENAAPPEASRIRRPYGSDPSQYVDLWTAGGPSPKGLAVVVHGGYWRAAFTAATTLPLAADLFERGWDVANVEYRRVGAGGGYPATLEDAAAAIGLAVDEHKRADARVALIGHSVGGELALLNAARADVVLGLAPVTDVVRIFREGLGDNAAVEFIKEGPDREPAAYKAASPRWQLPTRTPVLITHGADDARVPIQHSRDYRAAAEACGDHVELREYALLAHGDQINPAAPHWPDAAKWIESVRVG